MIRVSVRRRGEAIASIRVEGHAEYADSGLDIICAGVSALMQALEIGVVEVVRSDGADVIKLPEEGLMEVGVPENSDEMTQVLFRTVHASLQGIERSYPGYLEISEVEQYG